MIRRITWKLMSKHVDGLDEEMVEELHQLFLRMKMPGGYWHQGRDIVGEEIHGCGVPEYVERTFTLDGLVNMAVAKLTLDGGLALECVLNSLLEKDGTPEERKKVGSISAKIIERDNGKPHRRESAKYDFAGATIEKFYVESTVNEYNYGHEKEKQDGYTDEEELYPALKLLCQLVKEAVEAGKQAKYILMPQRAAMEAEVMLPPIDADWYNSQFGTKLNKVNLSNWLNGTGGTDYDPKELEPMTERFRMLKKK